MIAMVVVAAMVTMAAMAAIPAFVAAVVGGPAISVMAIVVVRILIHTPGQYQDA